jgi:hypothetical protein
LVGLAYSITDFMPKRAVSTRLTIYIWINKQLRRTIKPHWLRAEDDNLLIMGCWEVHSSEQGKNRSRGDWAGFLRRIVEAFLAEKVILLRDCRANIEIR